MSGDLLKVKCLNSKTKVEESFVLNDEMRLGYFIHDNQLREFLFSFIETSFVNNLFSGSYYFPEGKKKHCYDDIGVICEIVTGIVRFKWFKIIQPDDIHLFPNISEKFIFEIDKISVDRIHEYNQSWTILKTVETIKQLKFDKIYLSFYDTRTDDIENLDNLAK